MCMVFSVIFWVISVILFFLFGTRTFFFSASSLFYSRACLLLPQFYVICYVTWSICVFCACVRLQGHFQLRFLGNFRIQYIIKVKTIVYMYTCIICWIFCGFFCVCTFFLFSVVLSKSLRTPNDVHCRSTILHCFVCVCVHVVFRFFSIPVVFFRCWVVCFWCLRMYFVARCVRFRLVPKCMKSKTVLFVVFCYFCPTAPVAKIC